MSDPDSLATVVGQLGTPVMDPALGLSWSGGKDSALALWRLREREGRVPSLLLSTVTAEYERLSMHGVRQELIRSQAQRANIPLLEVEIPARCSNETYEDRMAAALSGERMALVEEMAFGDLFLRDIREYRESRVGAIGRRASFPVWGIDTAELASDFISLGFKAILVCVDPRALDPAFAGREFDELLLSDLPDSVDRCGENGEFHTFVYDGPIFDSPIACTRGDVVERDGFIFCDLLATHSG